MTELMAEDVKQDLILDENLENLFAFDVGLDEFPLLSFWSMLCCFVTIVPFSFGMKNAASIKLMTKMRLERSAGALLSTCLYKKAPAEGPTMNPIVELAFNLPIYLDLSSIVV